MKQTGRGFSGVGVLAGARGGRGPSGRGSPGSGRRRCRRDTRRRPRAAWSGGRQRPPQSMHVITRSGSSTPLSLTRCVSVAGEFRGRRLVAPAGTSTRPTTDRVREATFNALGSRDLVVGAQVADLFAGSGAIGIEALSRGAEHCTFVERDRDALRALRTNLDTLGIADRSRVVTGDVLAVAAAVDADLVFADPPYDFDGVGPAARRVAGAVRRRRVGRRARRRTGRVGGSSRRDRRPLPERVRGHPVEALRPHLGDLLRAMTEVRLALPWRRS